MNDKWKIEAGQSRGHSYKLSRNMISNLITLVAQPNYFTVTLLPYLIVNKVIRSA